MFPSQIRSTIQFLCEEESSVQVSPARNHVDSSESLLLQTAAFVAVSHVTQHLEDDAIRNVVLPKLLEAFENNSADARVLMDVVPCILSRLEKQKIIDCILPLLCKVKLQEPEIVVRVVSKWSELSLWACIAGFRIYIQSFDLATRAFSGRQRRNDDLSMWSPNETYHSELTLLINRSSNVHLLVNELSWERSHYWLFYFYFLLHLLLYKFAPRSFHEFKRL